MKHSNWRVAALASACALVPLLGVAGDDDRSNNNGLSNVFLSTNIIGSWTCQSGPTPVGPLGLTTTFSSDNTFQIGTDNAIFGETHGVYKRIGVRTFQSFDKAFIYNAQGFADRVRVARAQETLLSATRMRINVDITIEDRRGQRLDNFDVEFACNRMLVDFDMRDVLPKEVIVGNGR
jgi:hypothetical protein